MQTIQFELPESLTNELKALRGELQEIKANFKPKEHSTYISRQEVADMLQISLVSVHNWTKKDVLQAYQIGGRVYYKRKEVEDAIVQLNK
jgi:hypothetical protein